MINLMPTEKQVRITDQLYSLRQARRRYHGANWPAVVAEQKPLLDAIAKKYALAGPIEAVVRLSTLEPLPADAAALLLAVAVEIIEPSPE